ncbi:hypothetical protein M426DRAFT_11316 [Hypoxylon sp. CI-4A]|nr:hypothetical protein M426DRAFT_11316 [Hypoxylon sp. CI-4A]
MFYSHESTSCPESHAELLIVANTSLQSSQAANMVLRLSVLNRLIATVGRNSSAGRVSRKAIQEVDVQKACGQIIEPGAPVALRLQGQLLYGVSRVYSQQCAYMLADLIKIQTHMHVFFTKFGQNQLDPAAGQARPENLIIMNDPDFVPELVLPAFDFDSLVANSQGTNKTSSQMSPFGSSLISNSQSPNEPIHVHLGLRSDTPGPHNSQYGLQGLSSSQKPEAAPLVIHQDEEFVGGDDWGMEIDENGNILEIAEPAIVQDDFDLPPLPTGEGENRGQVDAQQPNQQNTDEQGDIIMEDMEQVQAEVFPQQQQQQQRNDHDAFVDDQPRPAPSRRKRKARVLQADEETQISRAELKDWQNDYLQNCTTKKVRTAGPAQSKANAMLLTFGLGLGNIGRNLGVPRMIYPLALEFSGDSLFTTFTGLQVLEQPRGTRRSASESIQDDDELNERRVRPRLDDEANQQGRGQAGEDVFIQDDQMIHSSPEVGREAQPPMSDHLSSALRMPWNQGRGSSLIPGSSVRGSAQKGRTLSSPLNRGNIQDLEHFSDGPSLGGGGDDFGMGILPSDDFDGFNLQEGAGASQEPQQQEGSLGIETMNFFDFMEDTIRDNGERRSDEDFDINRKWIAFDDVFVPLETKRSTACQAFYHTLCLATKGRVSVEQAGQGTPNDPFGGIWVGVKLEG